jgi:hypothetical protein
VKTLRRFPIVLTAAFILTACASAGTNPTVSNPALVGTWEGTQVSYGGLGTTLLLGSDGTIAIVFGAMVGGEYKIEGNQLTLLPEPAGGGSPDVMTLAFAGDTAVISAGGMSRKLIPLEAKTTPASLAGQWHYTHYTGVPAYEEYTSDGTMRLRVPMQVINGTDSVTGSTIRTRLSFTAEQKKQGAPRAFSGDIPYTLKGDTLTVQPGKQNATVFIRARPLLPYNIQQPRLPIR